MESQDPLRLGAALLSEALLKNESSSHSIGNISGYSIRDAAARIAPFTKRTPVLQCDTMKSMIFGPSSADKSVFFKCENFQKVGAFKFRGACNAVMATPKQAAEAGFVTESSGNHGQALSLACKLLSYKATIVMPNDAPKVKVEAVRGYGADIVQVEAAKRRETTEKIVHDTNKVLIHPSNEPLVMSGQGTAFLELYAQVKGELDCVIVPVGGGGLLSGVVMAAKTLSPDIVVIAGEPKLADDAYRSIESGELQGHRGGVVPSTIADGLRTTLGSNTFPVVKALVDKIILVEENEIRDAMRLVYERMKIVIEPSSAVAVAAALSKEFPANSFNKIGIILSGGNVSVCEKLPFQT